MAAAAPEEDIHSPEPGARGATGSVVGPAGAAGLGARTLIKAPARAWRGEVIALSALIGHVMETGFRPDGNGRNNLPRNILRRFVCRYNGVEVFAADLHPAISANPYLAFHTVATESGTLSFHWRGDQGFEHSVSRAIEVVDGG